MTLGEWWQSWLAGGAAILVMMTVLWVISVVVRNASIVDAWWGPGFVLAAVVYALTGQAPAERKILVVTLVALWGLRLGLHIGIRNHGKGEDPRYQAFRQQFGPERYWWVSFFQVYLLQGALMWLISAPLLAVAWVPLSGWSPFDAAGVLLFFTGLGFEAIGDAQLAAFKRNPANKGRVMTTGLWRYTRHPNYFGDATLWWGLFLIACGSGAYLAAVSPLLMTWLLTRVSGVSLLEKTMSQRPGYAEYIARTSSFFPRPPKSG